MTVGRRNDISIVVDGVNVWVVQGAHDLPGEEREDDLYYSQLAHRCVAVDGEGSPHVCTPTEAHAQGWAIKLMVGRPKISAGINLLGKLS